MVKYSSILWGYNEAIMNIRWEYWWGSKDSIARQRVKPIERRIFSAHTSERVFLCSAAGVSWKNPYRRYPTKWILKFNTAWGLKGLKFGDFGMTPKSKRRHFLSPEVWPFLSNKLWLVIACDCSPCSRDLPLLETPIFISEVRDTSVVGDGHLREHRWGKIQQLS